MIKCSVRGNFVRATIHKLKILQESDLNCFVLRMELGNQIQESEKLTGREFDLNKVKYYKLVFLF